MLEPKDFEARISELGEAQRTGGVVRRVSDGGFTVAGLGAMARIGDGVLLERPSRTPTGKPTLTPGEIVGLTREGDDTLALAMSFGAIEGAAIGDRVWLSAVEDPAPSDGWLGRALDARGRPFSGPPIAPGLRRTPLRADPPRALERRAVGPRRATGHAAFDTILPLCRGQRVGVFAGSGVGKSRLMAALAQRMDTDVAVIGLIGERGREVRDFVDNTLGAEAMKRSVVIAATSDQPAALKRRAAWLTLATAEYFRDEGKQVLLLFDSLTRFAEAHREVALTGGENAALGGFPPSTVNMIASLAERAGPGVDREGVGDITAIFTVLVAGSDMDEPVADMTRGILDGHFILSREIAERGRFPAIDVRRSVSRSLPEAANEEENVLINQARRLLAVYEQAEPMIQIGLYRPGADPEIDEAVRVWPALDQFFAARSENPEAAYAELAAILAPSAPAEEEGADGAAKPAR